MKCKKCGSENVTVQVVSETHLNTKNHGIIWWCLIGFWWVPFKWIFFTVPALIVKIFAPKKYQTKTINRSMCACQSCGNIWKA